MECSPTFFERVVIDLVVAMGYGGAIPDAGQHLGRSGGGIDGIIHEDKLGLDLICIQAQRWRDTVGRPAVQGFAGSMEAHRAKKGVMITTSTFSKDAYNFVVKQPDRFGVKLGIDRLVNWLSLAMGYRVPQAHQTTNDLFLFQFKGRVVEPKRLDNLTQCSRVQIGSRIDHALKPDPIHYHELGAIQSAAISHDNSAESPLDEQEGQGAWTRWLRRPAPGTGVGSV